uniref:Uncharacterized protein n=2 Tax=viral metagenome TaxID=1070528 RepID=A0A6M3JL73_9ZZZZ
MIGCPIDGDDVSCPIGCLLARKAGEYRNCAGTEFDVLEKVRGDTMTHTPTPWHTGQGNGEGSIFAEEGRMRLENGATTLYPICKMIDFDGEAEANARHIVHCVNTHYVMLRVLNYIESYCNSAMHGMDDKTHTPEYINLWYIREEARDTITQMKGEQL